MWQRLSQWKVVLGLLWWPERAPVSTWLVCKALAQCGGHDPAEGQVSGIWVQQFVPTCRPLGPRGASDMVTSADHVSLLFSFPFAHWPSQKVPGRNP